jgi:DNA-binding SARP family transcriptional activator/tetratricopeptide (TPR) repeat protein
LLGPPQLALDGRPLAIPRRRSRALLYYLAAQSAPVSRDQLLALFWPDHERAAALQILRTNLHGLRKMLGAALLAADDTLALAPESDVDVRRFAALLGAPPSQAPPLAEALRLYRGDFLAGFTLPDVPEFDDWAAAERERYRRLAVRGWAALASQHELARDWTAALDALEQAIAFDPLQEDIQRTALRLQYLAGDRAGAIRRYDQLRRLLDDELGVPPMDETRALYDAIITDSLNVEGVNGWRGERERDASAHPLTRSPAHPLTRSSLLPFTGRAAELEALRSALAARKLALIEGETGIGKTRLGEAFLGDTAALALFGAAHELEQALPYQPIIEALRGLLAHPDWPALRAALELPEVWLAEVRRLLPELAPPGQEGVSPPLRAADESRLWEGINQFLLGLARQRPVVMLIDDLHWADSSTLALLGYLIRQSTPAPLGFLATTRPVAPRSPLAALLQTLTREDRLVRVPLARLSREDTVMLARRLSPTYAYPLADWLTRHAEGNLYIVAELLRYAREQGLLGPSGVLNLSALSEEPVVPQTIYSLIQSRLARLSGNARRVLDVAVAIGREFEVALVSRASDLPESAVYDALDELQAAALIAPLDGLRYAFDHSLTMEVAYREIGEPRHRLIHRQIGEALEALHERDLDAVAGLIASHLAEGHAAERAASYAFRAGRRAAELAAWAEAIGFYEQAFAGAGAERRAAIFLALGEARSENGQPAQAAEAYRAAIELAEARGDERAANAARLLLARALTAQSRYAEAIELARRVLASGDPAAVVSAELIWGTVLSVEGVDLAGAAEHLHTAASLCAAQADPATLAHITFELGSVAAQQGDLAHAVERYRQALAAAEQSAAGLGFQIIAHNNLAYHLHLLGDPLAPEHARIGLSLARASGVLTAQPYLLSTLGEIALATDDLPTAEQRFAEGLELAERLQMPERVAGLTANMGLVAQRRGQPALAIHRLSTARARADELGTQHLAAQIRLWLAPLLPRDEARARLAEARAIAESGGRRRLLDEIQKLEAHK